MDYRLAGDPLPGRVLVTGAAGRIGSTLRHAWRGTFPALRLTDVRRLGRARSGEELVRADLADSRQALEVAADVDVIVHLAAIPHEDAFERLVDANVVATHNVFEAARRHAVRRVVFASTSHVTGFYGSDERIGADVPVRPDTLYGATKAFGEAVGRLYADKFGLEVICVRIGAFGEQPRNRPALSMWLSPRDAAQLFGRAVLAPDVGFLIVYGASRTSHPYWDDADAAARLGYEPEDDADGFAAGVLARHAETDDRFQGGKFALPEYHGEDAR